MYLEIKLQNKKYTAGKINLFLTKEALKLQKESLELAESAMKIQGKGMELNEDNLDQVSNLCEKVLKIQDKKVWLLCEVFGNQFTADIVEAEVSTDELDKHINTITSMVTGVVGKN